MDIFVLTEEDESEIYDVFGTLEKAQAFLPDHLAVDDAEWEEVEKDTRWTTDATGEELIITRISYNYSQKAKYMIVQERSLERLESSVSDLAKLGWTRVGAPSTVVDTKFENGQPREVTHYYWAMEILL